MNNKSQKRIILIITLVVLLLPIACIGLSWLYAEFRLQAALRDEIYSTAEEGMLELISQGYRGIQQVEIDYAGPNWPEGRNPHMWFVTARVWAEQRSDGKKPGNKLHDYDYLGSYFLHAKDGWVHMSEGAFPELVGFWMKITGKADFSARIPTIPRQPGSFKRIFP